MHGGSSIRTAVPWLALLGLSFSLAQACGSSDGKKKVRAEDGGAGGGGGAAGAERPSGGRQSTAAGEAAGGQPGAAGDSNQLGGRGEGGNVGTAGDTGSAGQSPGAGGATGLACPVLDDSRVHYMMGRVQNAQNITFGRGEVREHSLTFDHGAYLAAFDRAGCFEWVSLERTGTVFTNNVLERDAAGNLYTMFSLTADTTLENADGSAAAAFTSDGSGVSLLRRGVVLAKYDGSGNVLYAKRFGNAALDPATHGYNPYGLTFAGSVLRISGSVISGLVPDQQYNVVLGEGETNETTVSLSQREDFAFTATFDQASGEYQAGSVRLARPVSLSGANEVRHSAKGTGGMASDGRYVQAVIMDDPASYLLNAGEVDQSQVTTSAIFTGRIVGYTAAGSIAWQRAVSQAAGSVGFGVVNVAADGSSVTAGNGPAAGVVFDDDQGGTFSVSGPFFWVSYDADGVPLWAKGSTATTSAIWRDFATGDLFVLGAGAGSTSFGIDEPTPTVVDFGNRSAYLARVDPSSGDIRWLSRVVPQGVNELPFRSVQRVGNELVVSARFDGIGTLDPDGQNPVAVGTAGLIWSGSVRYDINDGKYLGFTRYVEHAGVALNDGLQAGMVIENE